MKKIGLLVSTLSVSALLLLGGCAKTSVAESTMATAVVEEDVQTVNSEVSPNGYQPIVVQVGVPVQWHLTVPKGGLTGCNRAIVIPPLNIQKELVVGDNVIEFTPETAGDIEFTCWMNMIQSNIKVVEEIKTDDTAQPAAAQPAAAQPAAAQPAAAIVETSKTGAVQAEEQPAKDIAQTRQVEDSRITKATILDDGTQEIHLVVDANGYSPAIVAAQRGLKTRVVFDIQELNACNNAIQIPAYELGLDLEKGTETAYFTPENDFAISCWMGMLTTSVVMVDDLTAEAPLTPRGVVPPTGACAGQEGASISCC